MITVKGIQLVHRDADGGGYESAAPYGVRVAQTTQRFHESIPGYTPTPLVPLDALAEELGLRGFLIKDENHRFAEYGLNAFKGLGGSWCLAQILADRLGLDKSNLRLSDLTSDRAREQLGDITFATATDGNHGRGVAWAASMLKQRAQVRLPQGSAEERVEAIRSFGAQAEVCDLSYDDTVRHIAQLAHDNGWVLVQDTSWPGYEEIPRTIMQGYATLGAEISDQLAALGDVIPTHVLLQAGVGSMAGTLAAYLADRYRERTPRIIVVEPTRAACLFATAAANDGKLHAASGKLDTIMAGLACGEPSKLAWDMLARYAQDYLAIEDWVAATGMRVLANPLGSDAHIVSGESGASCAGAVIEIMRNPLAQGMRDALELDESSIVLCISTEGATCQDKYREIIWDGGHFRPDNVQ